MEQINLINKKIGIWGLGIVGKSAISCIQQFTNLIQILDNNKNDHQGWIKQTPNTIQRFLHDNDYIIASPGIPLHDYQEFKHKFITELDLFQQHFTSSTIAITGTLGKTSITTLLSQCIPGSVAAGNIGNAMLNVLQDPQPSKVILELSSFQLHYAHSFAPDLSIWTNFYPNHLDHHKSEQEYFDAKCNLLKHQTLDQVTLLPCNLIKKIQKVISIKAKIFLFCFDQCIHHKYPTFEIKKNSVQLDQTIIFKDIDQLSPTIYLQNWLIIVAALHLQNIPLDNVIKISNNLEPQPHRMQKVATSRCTTFYNDSKSTVWQATKHAINSISDQSCTLFLGGLSKGTDRTLLIQFLKGKKITVIAFGQEADQLKKICNQYRVPCTAHKTLQVAFEFLTQQKLPTVVLFSPAGASFDLFKNYIERGKVFISLVQNFIPNIQDR